MRSLDWAVPLVMKAHEKCCLAQSSGDMFMELEALEELHKLFEGRPQATLFANGVCALRRELGFAAQPGPTHLRPVV